MAPTAIRPSSLAARLLDRIDQEALAKVMVGEFRRVIPSYQAMSAELLTTEIEHLAAFNVALFTRCLREDRVPQEEEMKPLRDSAQRGAAEGARLEEIVRTYHIGARLFLRAFTEACEPEEQAGLPAILDQLMAQVEACVGTVTLWFTEERQHLVAERERQLRDLLRAFGASEPLSDEHAELARSYGITRSWAELVGFALVHPSGERRRHAALASSLRHAGTLAISEGVRVLGVVPAGRPSPPRSGLLRIIGPPSTRGEIEEILELIRQTADLASRRGLDGDRTIEELLPELLLARSPLLARTLHEQVLRPLSEHDAQRGGQLVETLRRYVDSGLERTVVAAELDVHPNTVDHRIRRFRELTGLDLRRPDHVLRTTLALKVDRDG